MQLISLIVFRNVIQSEAKNLENIHVGMYLVCVTEILPPFGRLNDNSVKKS